MTVKKHNGKFVTNSIVGYTTYSGAFFRGHRLVKEVYVPEIGEYRWFAQDGKIDLSENKFVPDNATDLRVVTDKEINDGYPEIWTPEEEFKKGDILVGTDPEGTRVLLYFESENCVHRLTKYLGSARDVSWAGLALYRDQLKDLKVLTTAGTVGSKRFSEI